MKPLLIIKTGTTVSSLYATRGDFERWIADALEVPHPDLMVAEVWRGAPLPEPEEVCAVIITGSPAMVTDREAWSEATAAWLVNALEHELPVLGICYGHQLLAHALGGVVDYHPQGREIGTVEVCLCESAAEDPLFGQSGVCFPAHVSHSQTVVRLPEQAVVLAANEFEPHQAVRYRPYCWGVQYHPEFDEEIMRAYILARTEVLRSEGLDPEYLLSSVSAAERAGKVMQSFLELARQMH